MSWAAVLYEWKTCGEESCPLCQRLNGVRQTAAFWQASVLPGFHKGCDCQLVLVETTAPANAVRLLVSTPAEKTEAAGQQKPRYHLPDRRVLTVQLH
jgi:hypothetical protein